MLFLFLLFFSSDEAVHMSKERKFLGLLLKKSRTGDKWKEQNALYW